MKASDINPFDWQRILVGEVPPEYFIELIIRAICIYIILVIAMRSMGKRMASQLSRNEMAALVSLAAAIGVPMMAPDRGILPAIVVAFVIVGVQRIIAKRAFFHQRFEHFSQGNTAELLGDGVIDQDALADIGLSRERLIAELRANGIVQLGELRRVYLEANGGFSIIKIEEPVHGLSILPDSDKTFLDELEIYEHELLCAWCGIAKPDDKVTTCPNCKHEVWKPAVTEKI